MTKEDSHTIWISAARTVELITPEEEQDHGPLTRWLLERDKGWLALDAVSDDEEQPFQRPLGMFDATDMFEPWAIEDELNRRVYIDTGDGGIQYNLGGFLFEFSDANSALMFKLAFGGS